MNPDPVRPLTFPTRADVPPLPLAPHVAAPPELAAVHLFCEPTYSYAIRQLDSGGRVVLARALPGLGWEPGTRLAIRVYREQIAVLSPGRGRALTKDRHLNLPYAIRRRLNLAVGDQVLLATHLERRVLLVASARLLEDHLGGRLRAAIGDAR